MKDIAAHLQDQEIRKEAGLDVPVDADQPTSGESQGVNVYDKIRHLRRLKSELRHIMDIVMEHYEVEPIIELVRMGCDSNLDPALRAKIWMELQSYRMPKLKSVEHHGEVKHQHNIVIVRFGEDGKIQTKKSTTSAIDVAVQKEIANG